MSKTMLRVLIALTGTFVLLVILAVWLGPRLLGANVRTRLETDASSALGMQVQVGGRVALRFFPLLHVTLEDIHVRNRGADIASVAEVQLGIELRSLLRKELEFQSVQFKGAQITIERNKGGELNIDRPPEPNSSSPAADVARVSFAESSLIYTDTQLGNNFTAANCRFELTALKLAASTPPDILKTLSFTGHLACAQM